MSTYELASQNEQGGWNFLGDFADRSKAVEAAEKLVSAYHHDDSGMVVFGLSADPNSDHYEEHFGLFYADDRYVLIDPLP